MIRILASAAVAASLVLAVGGPARADNAMGYQLVSNQDAAGLPQAHGSIGLDVERSQEITDAGMTFDIIRVKQVRRGSAGAQAGFKPGDQIIAVDGRVFASLKAFAAYVGSKPGAQVVVDYMPAGGGPGAAQRVNLTIGAPGAAPAAQGMSTGEKVAIGAAAAALLGCYEMGCFSHRSPTQQAQPQQAQPQQAQPQQPGPQ
jgi:membrane-associated protease RseP (regulator of RpoE activity)